MSHVPLSAESSRTSQSNRKIVASPFRAMILPTEHRAEARCHANLRWPWRGAGAAPLRDFLRPAPGVILRSAGVLALLMMFALAAPARAQCPPGWLPGESVPGTNGVVWSLAVLPGGDVIVGGNFTTAGGVAGRNNIARYNPSTGAWSALGAGTNSSVHSLAVLPGGDVIVGGNFTQAGGNVSAYFARYSFGAPAPAISTQPQPTTTCPTGTAAFGVTGSAGVGGSGAPGPILAYQWQWQPAGAATAWVNLAAGDNAQTGGVPVLHAANVGAATLVARPLAGYINFAPRAFRCIVSNACGGVTSNGATLTVCPADFNCDGNVDPDDLSDFINVFFGSGC